MPSRIAIITAGGAAPAIIINRLIKHFPDLLLIIEEPESKSAFIKRRARKIGWFQTLAQLPTQFLSKFAKGALAKRYAEIEREFEVSMKMPAEQETIHIASVNDGSVAKILSDNDIALAFIVGGRMLSKATLNSIGCPILNFHAGFTPDYRGVNGGYWALIEGRPERFGGTVHNIDQGVDTGDVVDQFVCQPTPKDNLMTYQHLISAGCADGCVKAIKATLENNITPFTPDGTSKQHYHPSIFFYLWAGLTKNIW